VLLALLPYDWIGPWLLRAAAIAFTAAFILTPVVRRAAVTLSLYDRPDAGLKSHKTPIPCLGGVAMFGGWAATLTFAYFTNTDCRAGLAYLAAGGVVMMLTGLIDDLVNIRPRTKLLWQTIAAVILVSGGIGQNLSFSLANDLGWDLTLSQSYVAFAVSLGLVIAILIYATNATNLIDGLDGLCSGVTAVSGLAFALLAAVLVQRDVVPAPIGAQVLALAVAQVGICLGFLCYNFNPASIFMGDSGSLLLGYNIAVILVLLGENAPIRWPIAGVVAFGFPILDTTLAIVRRRLNGRPLFQGDRSHLYDQLRDRGWSVRKTVVVCYAVGSAFAALAALALVTAIPTGLLIAIYVVVAMACAVLLVRLGMLRVDDAAARSRGAKPNGEQTLA